jgi:hypothetical protein
MASYAFGMGRLVRAVTSLEGPIVPQQLEIAILVVRPGGKSSQVTAVSASSVRAQRPCE